MRIIDIEQEKKNTDNNPTNKGGRPRQNKDELKRNSNRCHIHLYLSYPCQKDIDRLRNLAKAMNKTNELRYKRYIRIANTPSEALLMMQAEAKEKKEIERRYRVYLRRQARLEKERNDKEFRQTVRALAKAIKNGKKIS